MRGWKLSSILCPYLSYTLTNHDVFARYQHCLTSRDHSTGAGRPPAAENTGGHPHHLVHNTLQIEPSISATPALSAPQSLTTNAWRSFSRGGRRSTSISAYRPLRQNKPCHMRESIVPPNAVSFTLPPGSRINAVLLRVLHS